jgi:hypothetical protein
MQDLEMTDSVIETELIQLINLHARKDQKKYMFAYSETSPKSDLVVDWTAIVAGIPERFTSQKKTFRISHWKTKMRTLATADCIDKVKWK